MATTAATTLTLELNYLEANQLEAALMERLTQAARAEVTFDGASLEADIIRDEIRWTGAALAKVQLALYGPDEPDEPVWLHEAIGIPTILVGWSEAELREAFGG
jgi:hypothetical protein